MPLCNLLYLSKKINHKMKLIFSKLGLYSSHRISASSDMNIFILRNVDPMWEHSVSYKLVWARVWAGPHISLYISDQPSAGRSHILLCISTVEVLAPREQAILFSHRWASQPSPPPTTISDLQSILYTVVQQQILYNNSSQLTNYLISLISHLSRFV